MPDEHVGLAERRSETVGSIPVAFDDRPVTRLDPRSQVRLVVLEHLYIAEPAQGLAELVGAAQVDGDGRLRAEERTATGDNESELHSVILGRVSPDVRRGWTRITRPAPSVPRGSLAQLPNVLISQNALGCVTANPKRPLARKSTIPFTKWSSWLSVTLRVMSSRT